MNSSLFPSRSILTGLSALLLISSGFAQDHVHPCGANDLTRLLGDRHSDPTELGRIADADAALEAFTSSFEGSEERGGGTGYVIPLVFHIIHNNGPENISDEQIYDAVRILNEDFNRENADWDNVNAAFQDIVADVNVEFRLAQKDPSGNCSKGITRTLSTLTNAGDQTMKELIQWPRNRYLNVWVAASADGAAGYTYRPGAVSFFPEGDGIVMMHTYTGGIGTSSPGRSRALTHEVGHWINLSHTWGNSNEPGLAENCNGDDNVSDTPNTIGWTTCNLNGSSCGSPIDNVENYMEYSYCSKMFTNGQATRMIAALNSSTAQRNQLWQTSNLTFTGVADTPVLCAAEFSSNTRMICAGSTVTFADESFNSVSSRSWTFPGGEPSASGDLNPVVTYTTPGTYPVTLTVSDGSTTLTNETVNYITVLSDPGAPVPVSEGFESLSAVPGGDWTVVNENTDNTFAITELAAFSGSKSVRVVNLSSMAGRVDELVSGTYDMTGAESITISFRYAFARRTSSNDDRLRLLVSNNCGATWSVRKQLRGTVDLPTAPTTSGSFVPNNTQWGFAQSSAMSDIFHVSNFRYKFEFESDGGNNVYIDDININGMPVGLDEMILSGAQALTVVPNPATDATQALFAIGTADPVTLDLLDVTGRELRTLKQGILATGEQRLDISLAGLNAGIYFLRLKSGGIQEVARFVVQ